ncbi:hypothetical protein JCM6882_009551 [Rhodosporidiobolus microsporus]
MTAALVPTAAAAASAYSTSPGAVVPSSSDEKTSSEADSVASKGKAESTTLIPWQYKGPVLALVIFFEFAVYWNNGLSSIKATIKQELGVNNSQYGVISSSQSLINSVVPFITGALLDYYGAESCSVIASSFVTVGYFIAAIAATKNSYPGLVVGEVFAGFGDITVRTVMIKISAHWFKGSHLGLALGLAIGVQRAIGVVSKATAAPIAHHSGYHMFFWISFIFQAVVLCLNAVYFFFERRVPQEYRAPRGRTAIASSPGERRSFKRTLSRFWDSVWLLPAFFWLLICTQILQNGVVIAFQTLSADMYRVIRGASESKAGWISAVGQIPVIILTPLTGVFFDHIGYRVHFIALSAIGWIIIFCLLAYTELNAIAITMLQSLPYTINLIPLQTVIALSVSSTQQGSAQGAYQALVNSGTVLVNVAAGAIQDGTPKGTGNYSRVLIFLLAIKAWDVVAGALYCVLDITSLDRILSRSNKKQREYDDKVAAGELPEKETPLLEPRRSWTTIALGIMAAQLVAAWVVYIKYSIGS